jgi:hypothetical protein
MLRGRISVLARRLLDELQNGFLFRRQHVNQAMRMLCVSQRQNKSPGTVVVGSESPGLFSMNSGDLGGPEF